MLKKLWFIAEKRNFSFMGKKKEIKVKKKEEKSRKKKCVKKQERKRDQFNWKENKERTREKRNRKEKDWMLYWKQRICKAKYCSKSTTWIYHF